MEEDSQMELKQLTMEEKNKALDLFDTPVQFRPEALKMLSQQELKLILLMEKECIPEKELEQRIGEAGLAVAPRRSLPLPILGPCCARCGMRTAACSTR